MSGQHDTPNLPDPLPALSDPQRGGLLSDLRVLEMRRLRGRVGGSPMAAPTKKLSDIIFRDPLDTGGPDRTADEPPPAVTPKFIQPEAGTE